MISCIPTHIPLIYNGILKYRLGFGFHTPQSWWEPWECKKTIKTTCSWNLKLPEVVATLLVGEITDQVHSQDDSFFNVCLAGLFWMFCLLWQFANVTCSCWMQHFFVAWKAGQSVPTYFSLPLAPPTRNKEKDGWLARLVVSWHKG